MGKNHGETRGTNPPELGVWGTLTQIVVQDLQKNTAHNLPKQAISSERFFVWEGA